MQIGWDLSHVYSPAGPIDTQMFARAFVANKCARNGTCKHMQKHRMRGGALALHTFWKCARVAENCARIAGNCARVAGLFSLQHFTKHLGSLKKCSNWI